MLLLPAFPIYFISHWQSNQKTTLLILSLLAYPVSRVAQIRLQYLVKNLSYALVKESILMLLFLVVITL